MRRNIGVGKPLVYYIGKINACVLGFVEYIFLKLLVPADREIKVVVQPVGGVFWIYYAVSDVESEKHYHYSEGIGYEQEDIVEYLQNSFESLVWDWGYFALVTGA